MIQGVRSVVGRIVEFFSPNKERNRKRRYPNNEEDLGLPHYNYQVPKMSKLDAGIAGSSGSGNANAISDQIPSTSKIPTFTMFNKKPSEPENTEAEVRILPNPAGSAITSKLHPGLSRIPLGTKQTHDQQITETYKQRFTMGSNKSWTNPNIRRKTRVLHYPKNPFSSTPKRSDHSQRINVQSSIIRQCIRPTNLSNGYNHQEVLDYRKLILETASNPTFRPFVMKDQVKPKKVPLIDLTLDEKEYKKYLDVKPRDIKKLNIVPLTKAKVPDLITLDSDIKVLKTPPAVKNTYAQYLKGKSSMREGFAEDIQIVYSKQKQVLTKELEEAKKENELAEGHSKNAFEAQYVSKCIARLALFDTEKEEEFLEEEEQLPELPDEANEIVDRALFPRPPQEVLVSGFNTDITRKDISTLADRNWLNDEVINFYMELIRERGNLDNYPKVHTFNTFFYPKLRQSGHQLLKRWTKKVDIFAHDLIVIPIHLGVHWCMSILDMKNKTAHYFDSMLTSNPAVLTLLLKYLEDESLDKKKARYDTSSWKVVQEKDIPQQHNGYDCGVFACMFAEAASRRGKYLFTQDDMPLLRRRMVFEILTKKLLA
ncbi:sentrin-specific protease-like isoform X2 [Neocloeon triangulifer]|uniref:sentrin-specific protease-like isoform X2 n=1 Tax=Neocloeon triangulifer TaxID=2078957 RepID=UPI00286F0F53|nr:sentrin-specific protease-like isoform X2 [Neocloeon triangulifer]